MNKLKVGVIGGGFVGSATALFECEEIDVLILDRVPEKCKPLGTTKEDIANCDMIFVAVNTPMRKSGKCDTSSVASVVKEFKSLTDSPIVVRSTVPPGTCKELGVSFMPEFLTEKNWEEDFTNCEYWVFGSDDDKATSIFNDIIETALEYGKIKNGNIRFVETKEAEMCKYIRNCFLATKVSFFNEMFDFCALSEINYNVASELATLDSRIGAGHTKIPNLEYGKDAMQRGYGGSCFPKDTNALLYDMKEAGLKSFVLDGVVTRNELVDRPEQDWKKMVGRAVSK